MNRLTNFLAFLKPYFYGFTLALLVFVFLFLKTHWTGFTKFIADPAFFDNVEVTRSFEVKK